MTGSYHEPDGQLWYYANNGKLGEVFRIKNSCTLRFDLLALEIFIASVIAVGLWTLAAVRSKALRRHKQLSP